MTKRRSKRQKAPQNWKTDGEVFYRHLWTGHKFAKLVVSASWLPDPLPAGVRACLAEHQAARYVAYRL